MRYQIIGIMNLQNLLDNESSKWLWLCSSWWNWSDSFLLVVIGARGVICVLACWCRHRHLVRDLLRFSVSIFTHRIFLIDHLTASSFFLYICAHMLLSLFYWHIEIRAIIGIDARFEYDNGLGFGSDGKVIELAVLWHLFFFVVEFFAWKVGVFKGKIFQGSLWHSIVNLDYFDDGLKGLLVRDHEVSWSDPWRNISFSVGDYLSSVLSLWT